MKITTTNDYIQRKILDKYEDSVIRMGVSYKSDRYGRYKQWVISFPKAMDKEISTYIRKLPRRY